MNARLVKLVGMATAKRLSGKAGSNVQDVVADAEMTPGLDGLFVKADNGMVSLLVTTFRL